MATKTEKVELFHTYLPQLKTLKPQAQEAYGSRDTASEAHEVSRKYTELLKEYADKGGSLLMMADALNVTYPALRRRVMTADIKPLGRRRRSTATAKQYAYAVEVLTPLRETKGATTEYHDALLRFYNDGLSMKQLALALGLKGEYPLYYGLSKARKRAGEPDA